VFPFLACLCVLIVYRPCAGGGFVSKNKVLYGRASADLKLVPGDSAGVVTAFYVSVFSDPLFPSLPDSTCLSRCHYEMRIKTQPSSVQLVFLDSWLVHLE
jgi:hypothetical protein